LLLLVGALGWIVFLTGFLRSDITDLTANQLTSIANYVAMDVDRDIVARQKMLAHLADKLHDLSMDGFRSQGVTTNAKGIEEISATASVPSANWFVVARLPTAEAHSPVDRLIQFIARNTAIILPIFILVMILRCVA